MQNNNITDSDNELAVLCNTVRDFVKQKKYRECEKIITQAMGKYPHAPQPHNLMGLLLENQGDHLMAMKHFRAAWALDQTYLPARYNIEQYADLFLKCHKDAYDETDCQQNSDKDLYKIEYDEHGIGHVIRRK